MAKLNQALAEEEAFWRQKSVCKWLCEGDKNTRFFQTQVLKKWERNSTWSITNEVGKVLDNREEIKQSMVDVFSNLLTAEDLSCLQLTFPLFLAWSLIMRIMTFWDRLAWRN